MGFLHPHILTPHQLVDALSEAKNHLRNGTRFPVPINLDQAHNVLKTLRITAYFSEGKLKPRSLRLEVRKLRLKIFLPLPRSNTRRTCCCPGHSTRKPRSYRLEARTLHLDPGLLPLEGLRTTLDIEKKKNRNGRPSGPPPGNGPSGSRP
ncbi:unnamed protein product, partial [Nesidiocoris tenuis]